MLDYLLIAVLAFLVGIGLGGSLVLACLRRFDRRRAARRKTRCAPFAAAPSEPARLEPESALTIRCPNPECEGPPECGMSTLADQARACSEILWVQAPAHLERWGLHPAAVSLGFLLVCGRALERLRCVGMLDAVRRELPSWIPGEALDQALAAYHWSREKGESGDGDAAAVTGANAATEIQ
jgi:hypothetical protein